ncbi:hypothetical protein [Aliivibrio kagoshimensis]|uniref:hypothetical protein n=1 Tax=Aliivibrio kagoshimensis TaxID=2910230 RepID=UPI003D0AA22E
MEATIENETINRDTQAELAASELDSIERPSIDEEPQSTEDTATENTPEEFDPAVGAAMMDYGLSFVEMTLQGVLDVPEFEFNKESRTKFVAASEPMLSKYGPTWLGWFDEYKVEISFTCAALSLIGGSAMQIKRLQAAKVVNEPEPSESVETEDNSAEVVHVPTTATH